MLSKIVRFLNGSYFEKKYRLSDIAARLITQRFYKNQFGGVGARSFIKKPAQIFNPQNITLGANVRLEAGCVLYSVGTYQNIVHNGHILIGDNVFANHGLKLSATSSITIGDGVAFGYNVFITDFDHDYTQIGLPVLEAPLTSKGAVSIGKNSWLGANVFVGSGVILGEQCVVAANSVVTKSFPSFSVIGGNPARLIKSFNTDQKKWVTSPPTSP